MSNSARSCLQCRLAKVKCDLTRPICGRCRKRGTSCDGYQSFIFRDETLRAQQLSRRARREVQDDASNTDLGPQQASVLEGSDVNANALQEQFPWLNERALATLPAQVKRDAETRAVERFFADWIVYPNEVSPGYMHHLPMLYEKSTSGSALHLAVRAVAFADVRRLSSGSREYELKGLQSYGAAITRLRNVVQEQTNFKDDQILAALLLIDTFETLYIGRHQPLGLHEKAVKYVLMAKCAEPLHSAQSFCLCRIALYRLQARQLLLGEDSGALERTIIGSLNQERPDLRVLYHVSQIIHLCARSDHLIRQSGQGTGAEAMLQVTPLLQEVRELISAIEESTTTIGDKLKPVSVLPELTTRYDRTTSSNEDHPMDAFQCHGMLKHHDVSTAFLWSFYAAAQIVLREHTIQVLRLAALLSQENAQQYRDRTHVEELAIDGLSSSIIRSFPKFMGFDVATSTDMHPRVGPSPASSLGRFLGVFAMIVVKKAEATSNTHKRCAETVLAWMHRHYQIS